MREQQASTKGLSILGLLGVLFVALKLCRVIDWSWWWVTLPFWVGPGSLLVFILVVGLIAIAGSLVP